MNYMVKNEGQQIQLTKKHNSDAGLDIYSNEDITVYPSQSTLIHTNLYLEIPEGHVGLIWSRSGLSVKNKIEVGAGCIDSSYRGEVVVHLYNFSDKIYEIKKGDRIAQLLTVPINLGFYNKVEDLESTDRGEKGFGSSGK